MNWPQGDVKGVWMDAGDGAVAALEAFEDAGNEAARDDRRG